MQPLKLNRSFTNNSIGKQKVTLNVHTMCSGVMLLFFPRENKKDLPKKYKRGEANCEDVCSPTFFFLAILRILNLTQDKLMRSLKSWQRNWEGIKSTLLFKYLPLLDSKLKSRKKFLNCLHDCGNSDLWSIDFRITPVLYSHSSWS